MVGTARPSSPPPAVRAGSRARGRNGPGPTVRQIQLASLEGIAAQATLTAGTWPGPPRHGGPVPVALPAAVASQLHVTIGSVLTGTAVSGGTPTTMRVTGLFRPRDPASPYWTLDLLPVSGISVAGYTIGTAGNFRTVSGTRVSYGPAVVNAAAFGGALAAGQASWMVLPQAEAMARGNVAALTASTNAAFSQLTQLPPRGAAGDLGPAAAAERHSQHDRAGPVAVRDRRAGVAAGNRGRAGAGRTAARQPARGGVRAAAGAWRH